MEAALVLDARATLGEGPLWHHKNQQLYWVDIEGKILNIMNPQSGKNREIHVGQRIGAAVPTTEAEALVALQNGIYKLNLTTEKLALIDNPLQGKENMRFNDGKCDPAGRFWVGSMHLEEKNGVAALYKMDCDGKVNKMVDKVTISNGIIWSGDHKTMYYIDTPTRKVVAYDYDKNTGSIKNPREVIRVPESIGNPDGMTIDEEGMLWIAHWGGASVGRWNPLTGKKLQQFEVPALNVTSCAFGGADLDTLYITTASIKTSEKQLKKYPHAGGIFAIKPGVRGVEADLFLDQLP